MGGRAGKTRNIFLVWLVWPLITLYYQSELNKIWAHLGNPPEGTQVTLASAAQG